MVYYSTTEKAFWTTQSHGSAFFFLFLKKTWLFFAIQTQQRQRCESKLHLSVEFTLCF